MNIVEKISSKIKLTNPSFMFTGIKGSGKRHTAIDVAKNVICKSTPACKSCDDCIRIEKNIHPDVVFIEPQEDDKEIKIESIRELSKALSFSSAEGGKRLIVIDEAHRMNKSSANALLKTLEEPPRDTSFILLSSNLYAMPATIISRCELVRFAPMTNEKMANLLNIEKDHPFLPYAVGSISGLSFFIANDDIVLRLVNFLKNPEASYKIIKELVSELMDAVSVSTKAQELENLEYLISMIMYSMLDRYELAIDSGLDCQDIHESIEQIKTMSKNLYMNTPASIVLENMLLEVAQCQRNL